MHTSPFAFVAGLMLVGTCAWAAATPPSVVVRGTIASVDGKSITIAKDDGTTVTAALAPSTTFGAVEARHFQQINSADFVGITSVPGPHDTLTAKEIHIIPWKGLREGSYPWDHAPGKSLGAGTTTNGIVAGVQDDPSAYTMTNANVTAATLGKLTVTYKGSKIVDGKCVGRAADAAGHPCSGVATVNVPSSTPIAAIVPARPGDAKAGLAVFAVVTSQADQTPKQIWVAASVTLEKDGVKPLF